MARMVKERKVTYDVCCAAATIAESDMLTLYYIVGKIMKDRDKKFIKWNGEKVKKEKNIKQIA